MERRLVEAFDAVHMDEQCTEKIQQEMEQNTSRRFSALPVLRVTVAACLVLALFVLLNPTAAKAVEQMVETVKSIFPWKPDTVLLGDENTYYSDGQIQISHGPDGSAGTVRTAAPSWLKEKNGHVYFLANVEYKDITGLFSEDEPFTYIYERDGITHYIAVGGNFDPEVGLESIGYGEWLRRTDKMEEGLAEGDLHAGWLGGSSSMKYRDAEGEIFSLWYARAIVELDIPWDNTEAREQLEALEAAQ